MPQGHFYVKIFQGVFHKMYLPLKMFSSMKVLLFFLWMVFLLAEEEKDLIKVIQEYRRGKGLPYLTPSKELSLVARDRTEALMGSPNLFNQDADIEKLAKANGFNPMSMGENIGRSMNTSMKGMDVFKEWIKSPIHKENITDDSEYTHIGAHVLKGEYNTYVSVIFARSNTRDTKDPPDTRDTRNKSLSIKSSRKVFSTPESHTQYPPQNHTPESHTQYEPQNHTPEPHNHTPESHTQYEPHNHTPEPHTQYDSKNRPDGFLAPNNLLNPSEEGKNHEYPTGRNLNTIPQGNPLNATHPIGNPDASTFLVTLPNNFKGNNSVLKLILVQDPHEGPK